jgi:hypothetical protein
LRPQDVNIMAFADAIPESARTLKHGATGSVRRRP